MFFNIIFFTIVILYVLSYVLPTKGVLTDIYGSSYYGRERLISTQNTGIVIDGRRRLTPHASCLPTLVLSPTGGGKSTVFLLNNLIALGANQEPNSLIVNDIKSELLETTGSYLTERGYKIIVINLKTPALSAHYNPLAHLKGAGMIRSFCTKLHSIANQKASDQVDAIWAEGSKDVLYILISTLLRLPNKKKATFASVIYLLNEMAKSECPKVDKLIEKYATPSVQSLYKSLRASGEKIYHSKLASAAAIMSLFNTPDILNISSNNSIDFSLLRKEKIALFLQFPITTTAGAYTPFVSIFLSQLFDYLLETPLVKGDHMTYALIDEMGNLKLPSLSTILSLIRSQRCSFSGTVQSISQIFDKYGEHEAQICMANFGSLLVLKGLKTTKDMSFVSSLISSTTKSVYTMGSFGLQFYNTKLLGEDKLRSLGRKALFLHQEFAPQRLTVTPIYRNKPFMKLASLKSVNGQLVPTYKYQQLPPASTAKSSPISSTKETSTAITNDDSLEPIPTNKVTIAEALPDPELEKYKKKLKDLLAN